MEIQKINSILIKKYNRISLKGLQRQINYLNKVVKLMQIKVSGKPNQEIRKNKKKLRNLKRKEK